MIMLYLFDFVCFDSVHKCNEIYFTIFEVHVDFTSLFNRLSKCIKMNVSLSIISHLKISRANKLRTFKLWFI